jgi:plastocyanin
VVISVASQAVLGVGIALSVSAIVAIYVTSLTAQNTQQQPTTSSNQQGGIGGSLNTGNNKRNTTASTLTTQIAIPQGAAAQQVGVYYNPNPATISAGSKVTWTNRDNAPHTATDINGSFDTGIISVASSGSAVVKVTGKLSYHCTIHPWMTGTLQVVSQS